MGLEELKPKRKQQYKEWSFKMSEATEILASERLILEYLSNRWKANEEDVKNIKECWLYEFRVFIQKKKDSLDVEWAKD